MTLSRDLKARQRPSGKGVIEVPTVSVVIPTYNSESTLSQCLESIATQDYPKDRIEVIVADGGSKDRTLEIADRYGVDKVLKNPLRTGEAGKAVGTRAAKNEIVAFIDSDNVLPSRDWLRRMVEAFGDPSIVGAEPLCYTWRPRDPVPTRYCALIGMNDPLCLRLGNYERYSNVTGRWTDLPVKTSDRGDYLLVELSESSVPTIGANGFLVRRETLDEVSYEDYLFDIDVVPELVRKGHSRYAKVKIGIVHLFADSTGKFLRKTLRRIRDYLYYQRHGLRRYPWHASRLGILRFVLATLALIPLAKDIVRGYRRKPDVAWLFHFIGCWLTIMVYGMVVLTSIFL